MPKGNCDFIHQHSEARRRIRILIRLEKVFCAINLGTIRNKALRAADLFQLALQNPLRRS